MAFGFRFFPTSLLFSHDIGVELAVRLQLEAIMPESVVAFGSPYCFSMALYGI